MITRRLAAMAVIVAAVMSFGVSTTAFVADAATPARGQLVKISGAALSQLAAEGGSSMSAEMATAQQAFTDLISVTHAAPAAINCFVNARIQSNQNNNFVSTEMAYTFGNQYMLRARATVVGPWELYTVCRDSGSFLTNIVSQASSLYVSEEEVTSGSHQYMLRARGSAFGAWEQWYTSQDPCNGCFTVFVSGQNTNYVSEEEGNSGDDKYMLRARASAFGPWESFNW